MSDLEINRAAREADVDRVLSLSRYQKQLSRDGVKRQGLSNIFNGYCASFASAKWKSP